MMEFIFALWLPIVVSSIVLFFASFAAWMILPHHHGDYRKLVNEDDFLSKLRQSGIEPGRYMFPYAGSHKGHQDPEFQNKFKEGPVGTLTVFSTMTMGKNMFWTFVFFLVVDACLGYLCWIAFEGSSPDFMRVFRIAGTAGILTYTCAGIPNDIWFKRPMWTNFIDGIAYGIIFGLVFATLWPKLT